MWYYRADALALERGALHRLSRWPWAVQSLSADLNINVFKDTYDYSCF
jgi:hypothetical protein